MNSLAESTVAKPQVWNVPNTLSFSRLLLSIVMFGLMTFESYVASLVVFLIAASTDWIDGYYARKYGQVTALGRVLDPFVDKIVVCGAFIFLAAVPFSGVHAWMTVVIVGRELLVTALRSYLEGEGADFSAVMSGKLKMLLQCAAVVASLLALSYATVASRPIWLGWTLDILVWSAVALTVYSGVAYVQRAIAITNSR